MGTMFFYFTLLMSARGVETAFLFCLHFSAAYLSTAAAATAAVKTCVFYSDNRNGFEARPAGQTGVC